MLQFPTLKQEVPRRSLRQGCPQPEEKGILEGGTGPQGRKLPAVVSRPYTCHAQVLKPALPGSPVAPGSEAVQLDKIPSSSLRV